MFENQTNWKSNFSKKSKQRNKFELLRLHRKIFPVSSVNLGCTPSAKTYSYYSGKLVGVSIVIEDSGDIHNLYSSGFFGKGNLSRSEPCYASSRSSSNLKSLLVTSRRKYLRYREWAKKASDTSATSNSSHLQQFIKIPKINKCCRNETNLDQTASFDTVPDVKHRLSTRDNDLSAPSSPHFPSHLQTNNSVPVLPEQIDSCQASEKPLTWSSSQTDVLPVDQTDPWAHTTVEQSEEFWGVTDSSVKKDTSESYNSASKFNQREILTSENFPKQSHSDPNNSSDLSLDNKHDFTDLAMNYESNSTKLAKEDKHNSTNLPLDDKPNFFSPSLDNKDDSAEQSAAYNQSSTGLPAKNPYKDHLCDSANVPDEMIDERCRQDDPSPDLYVIDDSEADNDDDDCQDPNLKWRPVQKKAPVFLQERLHLSLVEAFFLAFGLGCLTVFEKDQKKLLLDEMWIKFNTLDSNFLKNYIAYHYFRSRGWVPKSGLKFGCDFILYKEGPPFGHAAYSVIVRLLDSNLEVAESNIDMTWSLLSGLNRVTEQVKKSLMILYVIKPSFWNFTELIHLQHLSAFTVKVVFVQRWLTKQEREAEEYSPDVT